MIGRQFVAGRKGMVGLVAFACAMAMSLSGCSLTTPTRAEVEPEPVKATLGADDLIEDGVLTVAMDMTDAPPPRSSPSPSRRLSEQTTLSRTVSSPLPWT